MTKLRVGDTEVADYVMPSGLDIRLGPRPYLHPVRTLGGTVVTDALCADHPWHLGASVALSDVDGVNLWGGRTYVRGEGYVWLDDHGRIQHESWLDRADTGFAERLLWCDGAGRVLLREQRAVTATSAPPGWELSFSYALTAPAAGSAAMTAPAPGSVALGSPATHGRPGGSGYGGFFWRATAGAATAFTATGVDPHGSTAPWVALTVGGRYTLVFRGLAGDDRWFVRTDDYAGVCAALAYDHPLIIPAGGTITRQVSVLVADGVLTRDQIHTTVLADDDGSAAVR